MTRVVLATSGPAYWALPSPEKTPKVCEYPCAACLD
jgi:hypothetical protein